MNNLLNITAILDDRSLLENLVEKLATRRYDVGYSNELVPKDWRAVEVSSTEAYASGTLSLSGSLDDDDASMNIPFITSMVFTCIKGKDESYRLLWSSSMS